MKAPAGKALNLKLLLPIAVTVAALAGFTGCDLNDDPDLGAGEQLFTQNCGSCHTLTAAGTNSDVGPDLDQAFAQARASGMDQDTIEGVVESQISNPRPASPEDVDVYMPANLVEGDDAVAVAAYVASVAGDPEVEPPEFIPEEFFATNCGGCHILGAAGTTGQTGPDLDQVLQGMSPDQVAESIVDPNAEITQGFPEGVMPQNYGDVLTPQQLRQLVRYLLESAGGQGAGTGG